MDIYQINIILIGRSSVGKSSFINAIMNEIFSTTSTLGLQYYQESTLIKTDTKKIKDINNKVNLEHKKNLNESSIQHTIHYDFCDLFKNHNKNIKFTICDTPGYNDNFSNWLNEYLNTFDLVFFITDITNAMMEDDIKILKFLFNMMQKNNFNIFCIMNKCDNMYWNDDKQDLFFHEKTEEKIFVSSNEILAKIAKNHNICNDKYTAFIPFSSKGYLESRDNDINTGYRLLKNIFTQYLKNNLVVFTTNHLNTYIINYFVSNGFLEKFYYSILLIDKQINIFKEKIGSYDNKIFWDIITKKINYYVSHVISRNVDIIKNKKYIEEKKFNEIHTEIYKYCIDFCDITNFLLTIPNVDSDFMETNKETIINKLLLIYDQLLIYPNDQRNKDAANLLTFMKNINLYVPKQYNLYVKKFLEHCFTYEVNKFNDNYKDIINLMTHLYYTFDDKKLLISYIFNILLHNQIYILSSYSREECLQYLLRVKILIDKYKSKYSTNNILKLYTYEAFTNKNISHLTDNFDYMNGICFEIRNNIYFKLLFSSTKPKIKLCLDKKLIKLVAK